MYLLTHIRNDKQRDDVGRDEIHRVRFHLSAHGWGVGRHGIGGTSLDFADLESVTLCKFTVSYYM